MQLEVAKQFTSRSERVKGIDCHPTEPWILTTLYNGVVEIWSYATNKIVKSIQVTDLPVRAGRFVARKNWIVVGSDDFKLRVYNYNSGDKVAEFEAHPDYIRSIAVHATLPYVLTSSDDFTVRLWNWEKNWELERKFEGHLHYVMSVCFNPKDANTFSSACLDRTVKVWSLGSSTPNYTLIAHDMKGVNFVDYYPQADKPYLITASDDKTIKVWDYQTKACVAVLEGHLANVSFAIFHTELPLIISGSEDGTVRFWDSSAFKLIKTVNYGLDRVWCVSVLQKSNLIALGCDAGYVGVKIGNEEPMFSMDSNGKLIYAKNSEIFQTLIRPTSSEGVKDGEVLPLQQKELGTIELYPQSLAHSPNGRYAAVCGDGEYLVYTALAWRAKSFGKALGFAWNTHDFSNATTFAIRESRMSVKILKNFTDHVAVDLMYEADKIFPGALLGVKSAGVLCFYDWESGQLVREIDEDVQDVIWSDTGELMALMTATEASASKTNDTYILRFDRSIYKERLQTEESSAAGDDAFEVLYTLSSPESILSAKFLGDVLIYTTTSSNRLNYFVGGETINLSHFDHKLYILGYKAAEAKLYLIDKAFNVVSWFVNSAVLEFQTLVLRGDLEQFAVAKVMDEEHGELPDLSTIGMELLSEEYAAYLANLGKSELNQLARFFEKAGYLKLSFELLLDFDSKFQIALSISDLTQLYSLLSDYQTEHPSSAAINVRKWKSLGDLAVRKWNLRIAEDCYWMANDYSTLLLLLTSTCNRQLLERLAEKAEAAGKYNIAFQAWWSVRNTDRCADLLVRTERYSEAAFLGRTYGVSAEKLQNVIESWKAQLRALGKEKLAERLISNLPGLSVEKNLANGPLEEENTLIDLDDAPNDLSDPAVLELAD